ncbi:MAG: cupredoxin domain-containing protein [Actinomycetota bacterium]
MTSKLLLLAASIAVVASACAGPSEPTIDLGEGRRFIPEVVDFVGDVGSYPSITLNADAAPYATYWGFPEVLEEGGIPATRPIQSPTPPGVFLVSDKEGLFSRGAIAQGAPVASGVKVPFVPVYEKALQTATPENSQGTAVVVGGDGTIHSAWVADSGLWYGTTTDAGPSEAELVVRLAKRPKVAGPIGWPAITLGDDDVPWIAWGDATGAGQTIEAAIKDGDGWRFETVADLGACGGCPDPQRVAVEWTLDGPMVAFADTAAEQPVSAVQGERGWELQTIEPQGGGHGLSLAVNGDETRVSYFTGDGAVHEARWASGSWARVEVAAPADPSPALDVEQVDRFRTTGIAIDDDATSWVTWFDAAIPGIKVASSADGEAWEEVQTSNTAGGAMPDIAVAPDASVVYTTWYDSENQNFVLGTYADETELALANPSPTATGPPAAAEPTGEPTGQAETELTIVAPPGAIGTGFDTASLLAAAKEDLTVTFDNQDPGVPHNWKLFDGADDAAPEIASSADLTGPASEDVSVEPLDPGDYFYLCSFHPTTMTGTLTAA